MKNLIPFIIVAVLLLSGLGAAVVPLRSNTKQPTITFSEQFSSPIIKDSGDFVQVSFDHTNSWFNEPGYPMVPAYQQTITLPFGTSVQDVNRLLKSYEESRRMMRQMMGAGGGGKKKKGKLRRKGSFFPF
jgi:hypothetical protein